MPRPAGYVVLILACVALSLLVAAVGALIVWFCEPSGTAADRRARRSREGRPDQRGGGVRRG